MAGRLKALGKWDRMPNYGYEAGRDRELMARLDLAIDRFAAKYDGDLSSDRKTVFLFPGGMGSQLLRADRPYDRPPFSYGVSWLAPNILRGEARNLAIAADGVDLGQRYVLPENGIDFDCAVAHLHPYARFARWCEANSLHLLIFGWDWRLGVQRAADFFLDVFLPRFELKLGKANPLSDFTLIGHSAGGMVVKTILNRSPNRYVDAMQKAITVGAPFYGYGGQVHLYLTGHHTLNATLGGPDGVRSMIRIVSSMPGGYEFVYLDKATYDRHAGDFAHPREQYKLTAYPSVDRDRPDEAADPFNPTNAGRFFRYHPDYGFDMTLLHKALSASRGVSSPLAPGVARKLFNVRGVQAKNGRVLNQTAVGMKWRRVTRDFNPDRAVPNPITDVMGPGDGVQQAWGARLLGLPDPDRQVITVTDDIEHVTLMNADPVLKVLAPLLGLDPAQVVYPAALEAPAASRRKLREFLDGLRTLNAARRSPARQRAALDAFLKSYRPADLDKLLARAYIDLLKTPGQVGEK
jgi:hypothetical protein